VLHGTAGIRTVAVKGTRVRDCIIGAMILVIRTQIGVQTIGEIVASVREMLQGGVGAHREQAQEVAGSGAPLEPLQRTWTIKHLCHISVTIIVVR
jgi:hypothetical protein